MFSNYIFTKDEMLQCESAMELDILNISFPAPPFEQTFTLNIIKKNINIYIIFMVQ